MRRVVIIGLDGLSWNVLEVLFSRGVMSNVNSLRKNGFYGELRSILPPFTVPAWASLSTGVNPGKHGAYSFLMPTEDYSCRLVSSVDVRYPRIYEVSAMRGLNSVVINLPLSYPPVILKGAMISDWLYPRFKVFPKKMRSLTKDYAPLDPLWSKRNPPDYIKTMLKGLESRLDVIERLFLEMEWSLFFVVFSETDFLLHKMYDHIMSGKELAKEAYKVFNKIDDFIGKIVRNRPHDSLIFLVSDHGFAKYRYVVYINNILRDAGLSTFKIVKRGMNSSKRIYVDNADTIIYVPKLFYKAATKVEPARRVASLLFQTLFGRNASPVYTTTSDPHSSTAFMYGRSHFGIYINTKDVFRNGLMENKEAKVAKDRVKNLLLNVKNHNTGESIFERVYLREELFQGPYVKNFPHLIFLPRKEYWIERGAIGKVVEKQSHVDHSLTGIFVAYGEDVNHEVELNGVSILDVAPSILHYLGLPIPHDADGRVLLEIFKEGSEIRERRVKKAKYLEQWNTLRKQVHTAEEEEKIKERLRRLGYL